MRNEKGLTLIEVLASMVLLSIIVIAFVQVSGYTSLADNKSDRKAEAYRIAENELNELRTLYTTPATIPDNASWTDPLPDTSYAGYTVVVQKHELNDINQNQYNYTNIETNHVSIQSIVLFTDNVPRVITVTVTWGN